MGEAPAPGEATGAPLGSWESGWRVVSLERFVRSRSTVAAAVALLEGEAKGRALDALYSDVTARVLRSRGTYPGEGMFKPR